MLTLAAVLPRGLGVLLVFGASALLFWLAWGPLPAAVEASWLEKLSLCSQLQRLPLMLLTHVGGLAVGVKSPSVAIGASAFRAIRRRWPRWRPLAALPLPAVAVIGGAAGLGIAFRSPLLAVTYSLEEVGRRSGVGLLGPMLLVSGAGALVSTALGQPARLEELQFGGLAADLWGWAALFTLIGFGLGSLFVRLLILAAARVQRLLGAVLLALALTALAGPGQSGEPGGRRAGGPDARQHDVGGPVHLPAAGADRPIHAAAWTNCRRCCWWRPRVMLSVPGGVARAGMATSAPF